MQKLLIAATLCIIPVLAFATSEVSPVTAVVITGSGTTQSGIVQHHTGSGIEMEHDNKGLMLAIGQLSPADRTTLTKMIRDYLDSKGIDPAKYAEKREEIKAIKTETREAIKEVKKEKTQIIKTKREKMRSKIREIRENSGSGSIR